MCYTVNEEKLLLKPVYSTLRSQGYLNVGYIDDTFTGGLKDRVEK